MTFNEAVESLKKGKHIMNSDLFTAPYPECHLRLTPDRKYCVKEGLSTVEIAFFRWEDIMSDKWYEVNL